MSRKQVKKRITPVYPIPLSTRGKLSPKAQQQLVLAASEGYLVTKGLQQPVAITWRRMCEQQRIPYMRVRMGTRVASR